MDEPKSLKEVLEEINKVRPQKLHQDLIEVISDVLALPVTEKQVIEIITKLEERGDWLIVANEDSQL